MSRCNLSDFMFTQFRTKSHVVYSGWNVEESKFSSLTITDQDDGTRGTLSNALGQEVTEEGCKLRLHKSGFKLSFTSKLSMALALYISSIH